MVKVSVLLVVSYIAAVNCGALPPVRHGRRVTNGTMFQSVANYTCDNGYNLVGVQSRTCESSAIWSGNEPMCEGTTVNNTLFLRIILVCF